MPSIIDQARQGMRKLTLLFGVFLAAQATHAGSRSQSWTASLQVFFQAPFNWVGVPAGTVVFESDLPVSTVALSLDGTVIYSTGSAGAAIDRDERRNIGSRAFRQESHPEPGK